MIYKSLMDIADNFDTFFFDAFGVFNIGGEISKSVIDVMAQLIKRGKSVSILSNTPQTAAGVCAHYAQKGMKPGVHFDQVFSSGQLCRDNIMTHNLPVSGDRYYEAWDNREASYLDDTYNLFLDSTYTQVDCIEQADFIYSAFPIYNNKFFTDEKLLEPELSKIILSGLPIVCANPDLRAYFKGDFIVTQGLPCELAQQRGTDVIYYGKPYPEIYMDALKKLGNPNPERTLMIGDTIRTDILGATRAGIRSCLTLEMGITARDFKINGIELNAENLIAAAENMGAKLDYIIEKVPSGSLQ